jgi:hypothetical protein
MRFLGRMQILNRIKIPRSAKADPTEIRTVLVVDRRKEFCRCVEVASALLVDALLVDEGARDIEVIAAVVEEYAVSVGDIDASAAESACDTGGSINGVEPAGGAREVYLIPMSGTGSGIEVVSAVSAIVFLACFWLDLMSSLPPLPERFLGRGLVLGTRRGGL